MEISQSGQDHFLLVPRLLGSTSKTYRCFAAAETILAPIPIVASMIGTQMKSGHVYERRLILKYIQENGTDPITGEKLEEGDLVSVKASMLYYSCLYSLF